MAPILITAWKYRKAILYTALLVTLALLAWRVLVWKDSHERLPLVEKELAAERLCEPSSKCAERAAASAREAEERAAQAASDALAAASKREEQAQRDAAEWRRRYLQAQKDDPDCFEWSKATIRCPL